MSWRDCGLGRTLCSPLASNRNQGYLIRRKRCAPSRKEPKNREVTWCYNRQEDLTLFGSTPVVQHNKLSGRPVGRVRCRCEAWPRCSDNDRSAMLADLTLRPHARTSRTIRSIDMLLTRFRLIARLIFAAAAGLVAASTLCGSLAFAGGNNGAMFNRSAGQGQWQAANRNAMRVDDVERGAQPFRYQRVAAGSALTPISAEVHGGPRAEQGAQLRTGGSIRADIARYNEERSTPRPSGRQADDPRSPANSPYRN
jgi:hypothetical protein